MNKTDKIKAQKDIWEYDIYAITEDINGLVSWAGRWEFECNLEKCEVMHLGNIKQGSGIYHKCKDIMYSRGTEGDWTVYSQIQKK